MTKPTDADRLASLLAWADDVRVEDLEVEDTSDLAAVGAAQAAVQAQLQALDAAVAAARRNGRSWTEIGQRVGITRQATVKRWKKTVEGLPPHPALDDHASASEPEPAPLRWSTVKTAADKTPATTHRSTHHRVLSAAAQGAPQALPAAAKTAVHHKS